MNEAGYIRRIHGKLNCYVWKIHTTMQKGKLDCFYAWGPRHLWIEYKYIKYTPRTINLSRLLTPLQHEEIKTHIRTKQPCLIVVGTPDGGYLFEAHQHNQCHAVSNEDLISDNTLICSIYGALQFFNPPGDSE